VELVPEELLEISPEDATALEIKDDEWVRVSSRRGEIKVKVKVTDRSQAGNVFLAFHHRNTLTNILTSGYRDPITGTPEYKACAVRVEKFQNIIMPSPVDS
jgi:predicted molibdopterin-dependent oxidoreductase YjgC